MLIRNSLVYWLTVSACWTLLTTCYFCRRRTHEFHRSGLELIQQIIGTIGQNSLSKTSPKITSGDQTKPKPLSGLFFDNTKLGCPYCRPWYLSGEAVVLCTTPPPPPDSTGDRTIHSGGARHNKRCRNVTRRNKRFVAVPTTHGTLLGRYMTHTHIPRQELSKSLHKH